MRSFPLIRDLVTDVSWNYEVNKRIAPFSPPTDTPQEDWRWQQEDIERVQEFRKCIECFLCQDVCHVLRNHETERPFMGPRYLVRTAGLEMHPIDTADRTAYLKDEGGVGFCNITKCCTEVCPEHIKITDNAIIPLKERVADRYYDPIQIVWRKLRGERPATGNAGPRPERVARAAAPAAGVRGMAPSRRRARRPVAATTASRAAAGRRAEPGRPRARSDPLAAADCDAARRSRGAGVRWRPARCRRRRRAPPGTGCA